jgi:trigger factor
MTVQFETPTPTEGILNIALDQTDVQPRVEKKLREVAQRVAIKGFRPGKAPAQMVKKMYGEEILIQEMNDVLNFFEFDAQHKDEDHIEEKIDASLHPS